MLVIVAFLTVGSAFLSLSPFAVGFYWIGFMDGHKSCFAPSLSK